MAELLPGFPDDNVEFIEVGDVTFGQTLEGRKQSVKVAGNVLAIEELRARLRNHH